MPEHQSILTLILLGPWSDSIEAQGPRRVWRLVMEAWHEPSFGILRVVRLTLLLSLLKLPSRLRYSTGIRTVSIGRASPP